MQTEVFQGMWQQGKEALAGKEKGECAEVRHYDDQ